MQKSSRKEFLKTLGCFGAGLIGGAVYDFGKKLYDKHTEDRIYNELKTHIHISQITGIKHFKNFWSPGLDFFLPVREEGGCGIILEGKYITMAHITNWVGGADIFSNENYPYKLLNKKVELYNKNSKKWVSLTELVFDSKNDIAIYKVPAELELPNFPCKPSTEISLGDEIYLLGNPNLEGSNIRHGKVSDLDGFNGVEKELKIGKKHTFFGTGTPGIGGDSGCPIVNSNFELIGLGCFYMADGLLGYGKRIGEYLKELDKLDEKKKQKLNCR